MKQLLLILAVLLYGNTSTRAQNDHVSVEISFSNNDRNTFQQNEGIFKEVVIKNKSRYPVYFKIYSLIYKDTSIADGQENAAKFTNSVDMQPWEFEDCARGGGLMVLPGDSMINEVLLTRGCGFGTCSKIRHKPNDILHSYSVYQPGEEFKAKILVECNNGSVKVLEDRILIKERDEDVHSAINDYYIKILRSHESAKYFSNEYINRFLDTCKYIKAKERFCFYIVTHPNLANVDGFKLFKKILTVINDPNIKMYFLKKYSEYELFYLTDLNIRKDRYKELLKLLADKDKRTGQLFYKYFYAKHQLKSWQKKCSSSGLNLRYFSEEELSQLNRYIK